MKAFPEIIKKLFDIRNTSSYYYKQLRKRLYESKIKIKSCTAKLQTTIQIILTC